MSNRLLSPKDISDRGVLAGAMPCMSEDEVASLFGQNSGLTIQAVLEMKLPAQRKLWVVLHKSMLSEKELIACALAFAHEAWERHGKDIAEPRVFSDALAVYDNWVIGNARIESRNTAYKLAATTCRKLIRQIARTPALAAAWSVVGAGRARPYEAARMAAYYARLSDGNSHRSAMRQVAIVKDILDRRVADHFNFDITEMDTQSKSQLPMPMPMDNSLSCVISVINQTSNILENGVTTADHGNTSFTVDSIPANSGATPVQAVQGVGATCAEEGTTGTASFTFGNGQSLVFSWNIPYTLSCMGDGILPYFYAVLQGPQPGAYQVSISNLNLDMCMAPPECDSSYTTQISPIVTISNLTTPNSSGCDGTTCSMHLYIQNATSGAGAGGALTLQNVVMQIYAPCVVPVIPQNETVLAVCAYGWDDPGSVSFNMPDGEVMTITFSGDSIDDIDANFAQPSQTYYTQKAAYQDGYLITVLSQGADAQ